MGYYAYDINGNATWIDDGGFKSKYDRIDSEPVEELKPIVNPNSSDLNTDKSGWTIRPNGGEITPTVITHKDSDDTLPSEGGLPNKGGTQGTGITPPTSTDYSKDGYNADTRSSSDRGTLEGGSRDTGDNRTGGGIVGPRTGGDSKSTEDTDSGSSRGGDPIVPDEDTRGYTDPTEPDKPLDADSIQADINSLWREIFGLNSRSQNIDFNTMGKSIFDFLQKFQQYFTTLPSVSDGDAINLASQAYNTISSFLTMYLQTMYERENWLYQQDYNTPVSQMKRLLDAGVNPAFYFGQLQSSTAGAIGSADSATASMQGISDTRPMWQRAMEGVNAVTSTVTGGIADVSGILNGIANIRTAGENINNMRQLRPYQIASMFGAAEQAFASAEDTRSHVPVNNLMVSTMQEQIAQGWAQIYANYDSSIYGADKSFEASKYASDKSYKASIYGADTSLAGTKYASNLSASMNVLNNLYAETMQDTYFEESDGHEVEISSEAKAKFDGLIAEGSIQVGASGRFSHNGKTYRRVSRTERIPSAERINQANVAFNNFLNNLGKANPQDVMSTFRKVTQTQDALMKRTLPKVARNYSKYTIDSLMQGAELPR